MEGIIFGILRYVLFKKKKTFSPRIFSFSSPVQREESFYKNGTHIKCKTQTDKEPKTKENAFSRNS